MSLPFELYKYHKNKKKSSWKSMGIEIDPDDFEYVYNEYIHATNCDLCNKEFKTSFDRQLDHDHESGEVRNVVCHKCNQQKEDYPFNTNTGLKHIIKSKNKKCKNGYTYRLQLVRNGIKLLDKSSVDINKLIKIRNEFLKKNPNIFT